MEREDEIRIIAYALWVQDGYNHTSAVKHWLRAEAIWKQNHKVMRSPDKPDKDLNENLNTVSKVGSC